VKQINKNQKKAVLAPKSPKGKPGRKPATAPQPDKAARAEALQQECQELRQLLSGSTKDELTVKYTVGERILRIKNDPNKYGKAAVSAIAKKIGYDPSKLYDSANVAECWKKEEVEDLLAKKDQDGATRVGLTWSHLVTLTSIDDKRARKRFLDAAAEKGMSVRDLKKDIADAKAEAREKANTDPQALRALKTFESASGIKKVPSWEETMMSFSSDDLREQLATPQTLVILRGTKQAQEAIKVRVGQNLEALGQTILMIEEQLQAKGEQPDAEEEQCKAEEETDPASEDASAESGDEVSHPEVNVGDGADGLNPEEELEEVAA